MCMIFENLNQHQDFHIFAKKKTGQTDPCVVKSLVDPVSSEEQNFATVLENSVGFEKKRF